ncbi:hypothetical protein K491DRAFT_628786 [Lophiostoma macrostomum CBS 122681]|uniref:Serine/threonine-protein kinase ppk6 n=1 Tax=Lophiostoma macrostomum CBS 122681 TaxID=1314788 RepID=A0A6A6TBC1_9PLEO|nr:hypothetical protein K491DRAFT_628786 [Lophiostoma macrostomum CBS 122681]
MDDLFAEFAPKQDQARPSKQQPTSTFDFFNDLGQQPQEQASQWDQPQSQKVDDTDDWGEFEGGFSLEPAPTRQEPFNYASAPQPQGSWQPAPVVKAKKSYDSNVLFDAEEEANEEDDFGDFEGPSSEPKPPAPSGASANLVDLMGDMTVSQPPLPSKQPRPTQTKDPASGPTRSNPVGAFGSVSRATNSHPNQESKDEESWDSFDDWEASIPAKVAPKGSAQPKPSNPQLSSPSPTVPSTSFDTVQPSEQPPTNVPPPGVLLSLFPALFLEAQNKLFKPMAAQTLPMRNKVIAEPATISYLQGYLLLGSVAARMIAGRKLRWKRDAHLSQGMRIGPASSRATSGMKLTGIDKSENMKEEREASDVVRAWKEQIGKLRHIVSAANQAKAGSLGAVPDIQETMPVRALKQSEGGVPARLACMLCGLKREERVGTVDQAVEDSFGEWWVEQVSMHRGCRNFWNEHKDKLRQR